MHGTLYQLAAAEQDAMRGLCFTPPTGIAARLLAKSKKGEGLFTQSLRLLRFIFLCDVRCMRYCSSPTGFPGLKMANATSASIQPAWMRLLLRLI